MHPGGTAMEYFAAIDVSLELSGVCVVDGTGRIVREAKVASEPDAQVRYLRESGLVLTRVGLEAGPLSQWLHEGLTEAGFEAVLLETRHARAALSAMVVKTDRRDARAASPSCCAWAGTGRCTASRRRRRRSEPCWSGASCCKASSWTSSSASGASCAGSGSSSAR